MIFISYATPDEAIARSAYDVLSANGYDVFFAPVSIGFGQEWPAAIDASLPKATAVLLIVSDDSVASKQVRREVTNADKFDIPVYPCIVGGFDRKNLAKGFGHLLGGVNDITYKGPNQILDEIHKVIPRPARPPRAADAQAVLPPLPQPLILFGVRPGSGFVRFRRGIAEVAPTDSGLIARLIDRNEEWSLFACREIRTVVMSANGSRIACAAAGKLYFAPLDSHNVMHRDWTELRLDGLVTTVHAIDIVDGFVEFDLTVDGDRRRIRTDNAGVSKPAPTRGRDRLRDLASRSVSVDSWVDRRRSVTATLEDTASGRKLCIDGEFGAHNFAVADDTAAVHFVRKSGTRSGPELVIRRGEKAGLWGIDTLLNTPMML